MPNRQDIFVNKILELNSPPIASMQSRMDGINEINWIEKRIIIKIGSQWNQ